MQILKIIGIILLSILALVILLILLILFVPIRYRIWGNVHEGQPVVRANASYLLHILAAGGSYSRESGLSYRVRVLWITLFPKKEDKKEEEEKTPKSNKAAYKIVKNNTKPDLKYEEEQSELEELLKDIDTDEFGNPIEDEKKTSDSNESASEIPDQSTSLSQDKTKKTDKKSRKNKKDKKKKSRKKKRKEPLKTRLENLWNKIKKQYKKWKKILTDKMNKLAFEHIKAVLVKILKGITPKKLKFNAQFSTGSPDTTAEILGVLAMFPIGYKYRWKILPDFESEKAYFEGDFDIKGRIYIFKVLFPALDLVFDKNCRRLFRMVKK